MPKLSRRETLARGGQVVAAAAVLSVAAKAGLASEGEDSELITLWQRYQETFSQAERLQEADDRIFPHRADRKAEYARAWDRSKRGWSEVTEIEHQIATTPASTFAGLAIKLRIGTDNQRFKTDLQFTEDQLSTDELNLMTALADAERLAGIA